MANVIVDGVIHPCRVLCLDKDGLLFDSIVFWSELLRCREEALKPLFGDDGVRLWRKLSGASPVAIDSGGPFALAQPRDEMTIAAAVIYAQMEWPWNQCLEYAEQAFHVADKALHLQTALKPLPGFPGILYRAKRAGLNVVIVTSDNRERTEDSLTVFGIRSLVDVIYTPVDVERGKPYPDLLLKVANDFRCRPDELIMVGDSLVDVEMARNAGALGIGIPSNQTRHLFTEFTVVQSLLEISIR